LTAAQFTGRVDCSGAGARWTRGRSMTLRIVTDSAPDATAIHLIGRIQKEHVEHVRAEIAKYPQRPVLDLDEVTLADVEAIRFLAAVERDGIELRRCPPFIREWIARERKRHA
jgi:hypothetical protein